MDFNFHEISKLIQRAGSWLSSDIGIAIQYISLISWAVSVFKWLSNRAKVLLSSGPNKMSPINKAKIILYVLMTLILPVLILINSWSWPMTWYKVLLQVLSWLLIGGFLGASVLLGWLGYNLKDIDIKHPDEE
jgi:hypothetical protein